MNNETGMKDILKKARETLNSLNQLKFIRQIPSHDFPEVEPKKSSNRIKINRRITNNQKVKSTRIKLPKIEGLNSTNNSKDLDMMLLQKDNEKEEKKSSSSQTIINIKNNKTNYTGEEMRQTFQFSLKKEMRPSQFNPILTINEEETSKYIPLTERKEVKKTESSISKITQLETSNKSFRSKKNLSRKKISEIIFDKYSIKSKLLSLETEIKPFNETVSQLILHSQSQSPRRRDSEFDIQFLKENDMKIKKELFIYHKTAEEKKKNEYHNLKENNIMKKCNNIELTNSLGVYKFRDFFFDKYGNKFIGDSSFATASMIKSARNKSNL